MRRPRPFRTVPVFVFVPLLALPAPRLRAADPSVTEIEVNQVLGRARQADGSLAQVTKFVAGKDTVVRLFLSAPVAPDASGSQSVQVSRNGTPVVTLRPSPSTQPVSVLAFACPSRGACGDWAAGTYRFAATVGTATALREGVVFETRKPLRMLAVPLKANYEGEIRVPDDRWKSGGTFTRDVYPVAASSFTWETRPLLDVSAPAYDLWSKTGPKAVWQQLMGFQPVACSATPGAAGCFDAIVGFMKTRIGGLQGFTEGAPASVVANDDIDMPATVAHETAHLFGLGDEYKGGNLHCKSNPPPPTYSGRDFESDSRTEQCTASKAKEPPAPAQGTLVVGAEDRPYEPTGRGPLGDSVSYMGADLPPPEPQKMAWTTWPMFSWLYDQFRPAAPAALAALAAPATRPRPLAAVRVASVGLWIGKDGRVELLPWRTFDSPSAPEARSGTHSVRTLDAAGNVLSAQGFTPRFVTRSNPPTEIDPAPVLGLGLLFPPSAARVQVLSGTLVLAEAAVPARPPEVRVTAPAGGGRLAGRAEIAWTSSPGPGGAPPVFDVEYDAGDGAWQVLASGLSASPFVADFDALAGGESARVRVRATDGFASAESVSEPFSVAVKAPEVFVDAPQGGTDHVRGSELVLDGWAQDLQDGDLATDAGLAWRSSRDGDLGRGTTLVLDSLSAGVHEISLDATNGAGRTSRRTVAIAVVEPGAPPTPLAASFLVGARSPQAGEPSRFEDTSVGGPARWSWSFGDGSTSTERSPVHAFAAPGTYPVTLEVWPSSPGGASSRVTTSVPVRRAGSGALAPLFVPVVLRSGGAAGSDYTSEMTLTNRGPQEATVSLRYVSSSGGGDGLLADAERIGPGRQLRIPDVIAYLRGKGLPIAAEGSLGTLSVTFEGLELPSDASVSVRTTTPVPDGGRAGLAFPALPPSRLLTFPVALCGLRQGPTGDRSKVALQNSGGSGDGEITLRVTLFPGDGPDAGRPLGSALRTLASGAFVQLDVTTIAPSFAGRDGWATVERVSGSAPYFAYGVLNDQVTSDGSFVAPVPLHGAGPSPGVTLAPVVEAGPFATDVTLTNLSGEGKRLLLTFASANLPGPTVSVPLDLAAGTQASLDGFVAWLRARVPGIGAGPFVGPLFVTEPGGTAEGLVVLGRTWNPAPSGGRYGVAYPAVPYGASSTGTVFVGGLLQDAANRTNVAFVNTAEAGESPVDLKVELFDGATGRKAGELLRTLAPRELVQENQLLSRWPGLASAWARVTRVSGENPFLAYAVVNDGASAGAGSGDGSYVPINVP